MLDGSFGPLGWGIRQAEQKSMYGEFVLPSDERDGNKEMKWEREYQYLFVRLIVRGESDTGSSAREEGRDASRSSDLRVGRSV